MKIIYLHFIGNLFIFYEKERVLSLMEVTHLRHQQDWKESITSNCLQREADYHTFLASGFNCYF